MLTVIPLEESDAAKTFTEFIDESASVAAIVKINNLFFIILSSSCCVFGFVGHSIKVKMCKFKGNVGKRLRKSTGNRG